MRTAAVGCAGARSRRAWVFLAGFLWSALGAAALGQDIALPRSVQGDPGTFIVVQAQTNGEVVKWYCGTPGLSMIPPALLKDSKTAVLLAGAPGTYTLICWTALNGQPTEHACCQVIVGPPPAPKPPTPPSELAQALAQALAKDGKSAQSLDCCKKVAAVARILADKAKSDTALKTAADVYSLWSQSVKNVLQPSDIPLTRAAVGTYLNAHLPTAAEAALDTTVRQRFASEFNNVATALEGLQ